MRTVTKRVIVNKKKTFDLPVCVCVIYANSSLVPES